jgi:protein-S-isoprenylcysteine O-methyltransferase Ste14
MRMHDANGRSTEIPNQSKIPTKLPLLLFAIGVLVIVTAIAMRWRTIEWPAWVWLAGFVASIIIRMPLAFRVRANRIVVNRKDIVEIVLLISMFAAMAILPLLYLTTGLLSFADYRLPSWASLLGAALQLPYLWLFWRSHADLGVNWSPTLEVRHGHTLVETGIYARIRHPMYAAIWIAAVAQPLLVHNWLAGGLVLPAFAAMWFLRVPREEALMVAQFGDAYAAYCRRTGRIIPKLS